MRCVALEGDLARVQSAATAGARRPLAARHDAAPLWHCQSAALLPQRAARGSAPSCRRRGGAVRSSSGEDAFPAAMTKEEAYTLLGIPPSASFDECLNAKNRAMSANDGDPERVVQIETAYDVILMDSMRRRLSGNVASSVRFADVPPKRKATQRQGTTTALLQKLPGGVKLAKPASNTATTQAAVFGALAAWTLAQGLTAQGMGDDVPGLQLALASAASVYFFREQKKQGLPISLGYTAGGLVLGVVLGSLLQSWLRVDIVPIGGLGSPATFVSEFAIVSLWAVCTFLA